MKNFRHEINYFLFLSLIDMIGGASDTSIKDTGLVGQLRSGLSQYSGSTSSINSLGPLPAAPLANQLALFSRELVDLLKWQPGCRVPFHKFIPNYHHYFGRQCRVADYGYTKLKDLFEALPHVVQIIGEGSRYASIFASTFRMNFIHNKCELFLGP